MGISNYRHSPQNVQQCGARDWYQKTNYFLLLTENSIESIQSHYMLTYYV
jgi:hypothetical protein